MNLWTVQHEAVFEELETTGTYRASWNRVQSNWRAAYRWMTTQAMQRTIRSELDLQFAPIWAWHSCSGWQRSPDRTVFESMFGLDDPMVLSRHQVVGLLEVPEELVCLSFYGPWCELLMPDSGLFHPAANLVAELWCDSGVSAETLSLEPGSNYGDIQAVFGSLEKEQVLDLQPAASFFQLEGPGAG